MNNLTPYLLVSACLLCIGFTVVVSKKNLIMMLMGVELMLNAININFVAFSKFDVIPERGQLFSIFVMLVAVAEISVGLAIVLKIKAYYKDINPERLDTLKN